MRCVQSLRRVRFLVVFSILFAALLLPAGAVISPGFGGAAEKPGPALPAGPVDVTAWGATADGKTLSTAAIQRAIDHCAAQGGGTVYFPPGRYLTGTLVLRSHVALWLEGGAVLLGSTRLEDYPELVPEFRSYTDCYTNKSLIYAEKAEQIAILGRGVIDGQGKAFSGSYLRRPYLIRLVECRGVRLRDVSLQWSPMWTVHLLASDDVLIDGVRIQTLPPVNRNNDGIDVDSCQDVRIANCHIQTQDDALVLKSTSPRPCRNIAVTNCFLSSHCNAFKLGTESVGGFQNIVMSNCVIAETRLAGIALETVDGGDFDGVSISNVSMRDVRGTAIFIRLGNRGRSYWIARPGDDAQDAPPPPGIGRMRNILISNVQASGIGPTGCSITGLPGAPVEGVTLSNVRLQFSGGGTAEDAARLDVPEAEAVYPEFSQFGTLPAYGFYCRHVENLRLDNLELSYEQADARPALVFDDVRRLAISGLSAKAGSRGDCLVRLVRVEGAIVRGCRAQGPVQRLVELMADCRDVATD